jgi:hypothetical protein
MKRAIRRIHLRRMKAKARKIYWFCTTPEKLANHLASCSCEMCGNPRRLMGERTKQEQRDWKHDWDV